MLYKETQGVCDFSFKRRQQSLTKVCNIYKMMNKVCVNCYSPTPLYQLIEQLVKSTEGKFKLDN